MTWEDILKRKLIVISAIVEINNDLYGYKNVEIESTRQLLDKYHNHEIKDIYDTLTLDPTDPVEPVKPNTYEYTIQCNVYDEERKANYTGILFSTYLDADTNEAAEFMERVKGLSFIDELEDANQFLTPMSDDIFE